MNCVWQDDKCILVYSADFHWPRNAVWHASVFTGEPVQLHVVQKIELHGMMLRAHAVSSVEVEPGRYCTILRGGSPGLREPIKQMQLFTDLRSAISQVCKIAGSSLHSASRFENPTLPWYMPKGITPVQLLCRAFAAWHVTLSGEVCVGDVWPDATAVGAAEDWDVWQASKTQHVEVVNVPLYKYVALRANRLAVSLHDSKDATIWSILT